jgi:PAS domain S-box-containing protein
MGNPEAEALVERNLENIVGPAVYPEWLYRKIIDEAPVAIIFADKDGIIRLWNAGAQSIFGYRADEAIGKSLDLIIPEKHQKAHWQGYHTVMGTGVTRFGTQLLKVPALRKDGARISVEFNIVLIRQAEGPVLGAAAILSDVTERWQQDRATRQRLADLEAKLATAGKG